jgi:hypothetical protein
VLVIRLERDEAEECKTGAVDQDFSRREFRQRNLEARDERSKQQAARGDKVSTMVTGSKLDKLTLL